MFEFDPNNFQLEDLDRVLKQSQAALGDLAKMQEELGKVTGTGEGGDGLVTAEVDSAGKFTAITMKPRIMRCDSQTIADYVLEAVQAAQADHSAKSNELMQTVVGAPPDPDEVRQQFERVQQEFTDRMNKRMESY